MTIITLEARGNRDTALHESDGSDTAPGGAIALAKAVVASMRATFGEDAFEGAAALTKASSGPSRLMLARIPRPSRRVRGPAKMTVAESASALRDILACHAVTLWSGAPSLAAHYTRRPDHHEVGLLDMKQAAHAPLGAAKQMAIAHVLMRTRTNSRNPLNSDLEPGVAIDFDLTSLSSATLRAAMARRAPEALARSCDLLEKMGRADIARALAAEAS